MQTSRKTLVRRSLHLLVLIGLGLSVSQLDRHVRQARTSQAVPQPGVTTAAPPLVTYVTVGLAGFRGIIAEALWLRAAWLQERGRYLELVQLADWISTLDPRSSEAWTYQAWNMAYNVSAMLPRAEDRLRWVVHGIALLRDRAIPLNPTDAHLYRELGWLYQHKIGSDSDAAHRTYKLALAGALTPWLEPDGGAPAPENTEAAHELAERLRLDAGQMRALEARFGPLDWRLPETHALYWGWLGLNHAQGFDRVACRRMVYQNLSALVSHGRFTGDLHQGTLATAPNLALLEPTVRFFERTLRVLPSRGATTAYAHFLIRAAQLLHVQGNETAARTCYARLLEIAGDTVKLPPSYEALVAPPLP